MQAPEPKYTLVTGNKKVTRRTGGANNDSGTWYQKTIFWRREEHYTVTREGNIEDAEGRQVALESIINPANKEEVFTAADTEQGFDAVEITLPLVGHTGISLRNMINMIYSKQPLIQKALSLQKKLIEEDLVRELSEAKLETQEDFLTLLIQMGSEQSGYKLWIYRMNLLHLILAKSLL